ncbi:MAG TPA: ABC transporter substrate-binding protein [Desulfobacterales bacterium]|nr:ABC transporter substrate-binding protein [Desulfobacterales bacterium]
MKNMQIALGVILALCVLMGPYDSEAQQPMKVYRIGYLSISHGDYERDPRNCPIVGSPKWQALIAGLRECGYTQGQNLVLECRWTEDQDDRALPLATELVSLKPDLMVANGTMQVRAAKQTTRTIPIVMIGVIDPVGRGLVPGLARPGGNITGLTDSLIEMEGKRLQFLKEAVPTLSRVAVLHRKGRIISWMEQYEAAARALGLRLQTYPVSGPEELAGAFAAMTTAGEEALLVVPSGIWEMGDTPQRFAEFTTQNKLSSTYQGRPFVKAGGLMSYCVDETAIYRRVGFYVDKILKGTNPGDLPVEQPTRFNLIINLKTAAALGLTIPPTLLMIADEVID